MRIFLSLAAVVLAGAFFLVDAMSDAAAHGAAQPVTSVQHNLP
jgi:hypothetical protein